MANNGYNNFHGRNDDGSSYQYNYSYQYSGNSQNNRRNTGNNYRRKKQGDGIPIPAIVVGFFINPLLGIGLLIAHLVMTGVITNNLPGQFRVVQNSQPNMEFQAGQPEQAPNLSQQEEQRAFELAKRTKRTKVVSIFLMIMGALLALGGVTAVVESLSWIIPYGAYSSDIVALVWGALTAGGGIFAIRQGIKMRKDMRVKTRILSIVGKNPVMDMKEIARSMGMNKKECERQVQDCVDKGLFGWGAYLDRSADLLVTGSATPEEKIRARAQKQEKAKKEPKPTKEEAKQANSKYQAILDQLKALDDAIPGEEMSAKIRRLGEVSQKIFELVEKDPDKLPRLRKFMDYYLPTSLKLLTSYSQLDAQGVEGENITEAKTRIENTMDTLTTAFETQLDKLFEEDALDISSDIAAMEGMLKADGLAGGDFPDFTIPGGNL